jgi:SMODS and SLOG-associating 2TM effector domain 1
MKLFRNDVSVEGDSFETAAAYYSELRKGFREKANHNKHESNIVFFGIICFTLAAPLFVTMGEGWLCGKAIPATLSVLAAGATSWLQIRKPQRLWSIYRRAQRELEREKAAYDFHFGDYENEAVREKTLAKRVSEIAFRVHEQWEGLVPEPDALVSQTPSNPLPKSERSNAA